MRCYSRCCQINECCCSNVEIPIADELASNHQRHRQRTPNRQIDNQPLHNNSENDEGEHVISL